MEREHCNVSEKGAVPLFVEKGVRPLFRVGYNRRYPAVRVVHAGGQMRSLVFRNCLHPWWVTLVGAAVPALAIALRISPIAFAAPAGAGAGPATWTNDLAPIASAEWSDDRAAHLLERGGFGATPEEIGRLAAMSPQQAVDWLVNYEKIENSRAEPFDESGIWDPGMDPFPESRAEAARLARQRGEGLGERDLPPGSPRRLQPVVDKFFFGLRANNLETQRLALWWANRMLTTPRPLEEKLTLFWHGHFASGQNKVRDYRMMLRQNEMFRRNASGRFSDLLNGILKDPAMLV